MTKRTKYHFEGDENRCYLLLLRAEIMAWQMQRHMRENEINQLAREIITTEGDTIRVKRVFDNTEIYIYAKPQGGVREETPRDVFLVLACGGVRYFYGLDWDVLKPLVYTDNYYIVYKLRSRDYAKIEDKTQAKGSDGKYPDVEFPCTADKIIDWTTKTTVTSKDFNNYDYSIGNYQDFKVWGPKYFEYGFSPISGNPWYITRNTTAIGTNCDCMNWPSGDCTAQGVYRGWLCGSSITDYDSAEYNQNAEYFNPRVMQERQVAYKKEESCYGGGYCTLTGNYGYGGEYRLASRSDGYTSHLSDLISNGLDILGPYYDYYYFGSGYLPAANSSRDKETQEAIIGIFRESNLATHTSEDIFNRSEQVIFRYPGDPGPYPFLTSYYITEGISETANNDDYRNILTGYSPYGSFFTIELNNTVIYQTRYTNHIKNPWPYGSIILDTTESVTDSRDVLMWMRDDDPNLLNNNRTIYSLRSNKDKVFFQFFLHHWVLRHETSSGSDSTVAYEPPAWGFFAQCDFVKDAEANDPLDKESYIKSLGQDTEKTQEDIDKEKLEYLKYYDEFKELDLEDFEFNTPELEVKIQELIDKVYNVSYESGAIDENDPLLLFFTGWIVSGYDNDRKKSETVPA